MKSAKRSGTTFPGFSVLVAMYRPFRAAPIVLTFPASPHENWCHRTGCAGSLFAALQRTSKASRFRRSTGFPPNNRDEAGTGLNIGPNAIEAHCGCMAGLGG
jgi:hypothetical protein